MEEFWEKAEGRYRKGKNSSKTPFVSLVVLSTWGRVPVSTDRWAQWYASLSKKRLMDGSASMLWLLA